MATIAIGGIEWEKSRIQTLARSILNSRENAWNATSRESWGTNRNFQREDSKTQHIHRYVLRVTCYE